MNAKRIAALLLSLAALFSLCACGKSNFEPSTEEDAWAYAILSRSVPDYKKEGVDVVACGPCKVYEDYEGLTLVYTTLCRKGEGDGIGNTAYGLFDGAELKEYYWYGDSIQDLERLRESTENLEYSTFEVSEAVCDALGIETYQALWTDYATTMACDYLMELMNYLKNPYTIEVNSISCYVKPYGVYQAGSLDAAVFFTINFTSENSVGGKVTSVVGNTENAGLSLNSTSYKGSMYGRTMYFVDDETYAKQQPSSFSLDCEKIQSYILEHYQN